MRETVWKRLQKPYRDTPYCQKRKYTKKLNAQGLQKMEVLILATCPYMFPRGKSLSVHTLNLALHDLGHDMTILSYANGSEANISHARILRTPHILRMRRPHKTGLGLAKSLSDLAMLYMAQKTIKQNHYDLIIAIDIEGSIIAAILKKYFSLPVVMYSHGIFSELLKNNTRWVHYFLGGVCDQIERVIWNRADFLICNWPHVSKRASKVVPLIDSATLIDAPSKSIWGVVERPFPSTEEGMKWKKLLSKKKVVLYVGNFARYQGFDQVLRGIRYAFNRGLKETVLLVIGGDYKQVKKKALRLGLIENVIFLGRKTPEESVDLMRLADVCLSMNCVGGNAPSKIIHYFLAGAPILACNAPANRQLLKNEDDAAFCLNDPEHFATVLMDLLDDEAALKKLARRSRKNAQQFTFETYRDKLNKCINQAMNQ